MKRMFSKRIVDADRFLDLPPAARLLYFELNLRCDDDGFCSGPKTILRMTGAGKGDLQALRDAGLILDFDGIVVITDWRIHNCLRADRLQPLSFPSLAEKIWITEDGSYATEPKPNAMNLLTYRRRFAETHSDPLREMRLKRSEISGFPCDSQDRIG